MYEYVKQLIKDILSANVAADLAKLTNDEPAELKHLLRAIHDTSVLLQGRLDDSTDEETAKTYAKSLKDTAAYVKEMIDRGVK